MPHPGDMVYCHRPPPPPPPPHHHHPHRWPLGNGRLDDIVLLVGKRRHPYHVNAQSLIRGSAYFRKLLDLPRPADAWAPLVLDCDEAVFENLLLLMMYGTFEALPPMSAAEMYQLRKEASFYGVEYVEQLGVPPVQQQMRSSESGSGRSEASGTSSPRSSQRGSNSAAIAISHPQTVQPSQGEMHVACTTPSELAGFPLELADPAKMVLITCSDAGKARVYNCHCGGGSGATQWALNFHHRHAFCTACGEGPRMSAKQFAEMFMGAAAVYTSEGEGGVGKWRIGIDSTCLLRFVRSANGGADACGCEAGTPTIWAASSYHSHAFCTSCGRGAKGPVLLSVLLALRYGRRATH